VLPCKFAENSYLFPNRLNIPFSNSIWEGK
jgi:hypothetical protein